MKWLYCCFSDDYVTESIDTWQLSLSAAAAAVQSHYVTTDGRHPPHAMLHWHTSRPVTTVYNLHSLPCDFTVRVTSQTIIMEIHFCHFCHHINVYKRLLWYERWSTKNARVENHFALYTMNRLISVIVLSVVENWFSLCLSCVKWGQLISHFYQLNTGVRQGGVLSPFLFGIFLDDLAKLINKVM